MTRSTGAGTCKMRLRMRTAIRHHIVHNRFLRGGKAWTISQLFSDIGTGTILCWRVIESNTASTRDLWWTVAKKVGIGPQIVQMKVRQSIINDIATLLVVQVALQANTLFATYLAATMSAWKLLLAGSSAENR